MLRQTDEPIANVLVEQSLLGAILINNGAFTRVKKFLTAEHFAVPAHSLIFLAIEARIDAGRRADFKTIAKTLPAEFRVFEMNGQEYIARLVAEAVTVANARDYGIEVLENANRRMVEDLGHRMIESARNVEANVPLLEQVQPIEQALNALRFAVVKEDPRSGAGTRFLDKLTEAYQRGNIRGVPICLPEIQRVLSEPAFEPTNLYGLLSSSGEGKTSLMVQIVRHALTAGHPVMIQSYDQNEEQLVRQMLSQSLGIEAKKLRQADLAEADWEKIVDFSTGLNQAPFEVLKCTNEDAAQLVSAARDFCKRRVVDTEKPALIVTDHIGAIASEDERAGEGVKAKRISGRLKGGAEELDSAWLVLQQRNTSGMMRDNPRPISADLYGGESAKQAYDAILTLYRPGKYKAERNSTAATGTDYKKIRTVFGDTPEDVSELSSIKVRFGDPRVREEIVFEAKFTRYRSKEQMEVFEEPTLGGFQ